MRLLISHLIGRFQSQMGELIEDMRGLKDMVRKQENRIKMLEDRLTQLEEEAEQEAAMMLAGPEHDGQLI